MGFSLQCEISMFNGALKTKIILILIQYSYISSGSGTPDPTSNKSESFFRRKKHETETFRFYKQPACYYRIIKRNWTRFKKKIFITTAVLSLTNRTRIRPSKRKLLGTDID